MATKPKRPRDINQLAKLIVDLSTGDATDADGNEGKDPAAVKRGTAGGLIGGKARAKSLPKKRRVAIAQLGAEARWAKNRT